MVREWKGAALRQPFPFPWLSVTWRGWGTQPKRGCRSCPRGVPLRRLSLPHLLCQAPCLSEPCYPLVRLSLLSPPRGVESDGMPHRCAHLTGVPKRLLWAIPVAGALFLLGDFSGYSATSSLSSTRILLVPSSYGRGLLFLLLHKHIRVSPTATYTPTR